MRRIDYHMHTMFSTDSEGNPEEYIKKAIELGLDEICFTDHYDVDYPFTPFILDIENYAREINRLKDKYKDQIIIKVGMEMGLDPVHQDEINRVTKLYPFDFIIGSIHAVGNTEFLEGDFFKGKTKQEAHLEYFNQVKKCIETFDCFSVFGHLDYIERYGIYTDNSVDTDAYMSIIEECLKLLISKNKGLEVNSSDYLLRNEGFPKRSILQKYYDLGGRIITIGTDSHTKDRVGENVDTIIGILEEIGFTDITTFTKQIPDVSI